MTFAEIASNYGPYITAGAVFFSATIAVAAFQHNKKTFLLSQTFTLIESSEEKEYYRNVRTEYINLVTDKARIKAVNAGTAAPKDENIMIKMLNHHEHIALTILEGVVDESLYYRWKGSSFINTVEHALTYIENSQTETAAYYKNLLVVHSIFKQRKVRELALKEKQEKIWAAHYDKP